MRWKDFDSSIEVTDGLRCFRTKSGADDFARVLSFISSAALHGVSSFDAIVAAFRGDAVGVLFGVD